MSGTGCQAAPAESLVCTRLISESTEMRPDDPDDAEAALSGSAATTSIDVISGAAARTASSTANSRVTADDGQLLQLPANWRRTTGPSWLSATSRSATSPP